MPVLTVIFFFLFFNITGTKNWLHEIPPALSAGFLPLWHITLLSQQELENVIICDRIFLKDRGTYKEMINSLTFAMTAEFTSAHRNKSLMIF